MSHFLDSVSRAIRTLGGGRTRFPTDSKFEFSPFIRATLLYSDSEHKQTSLGRFVSQGLSPLPMFVSTDSIEAASRAETMILGHRPGSRVISNKGKCIGVAQIYFTLDSDKVIIAIGGVPELEAYFYLGRMEILLRQDNQIS